MQACRTHWEQEHFLDTHALPLNSATLNQEGYLVKVGLADSQSPGLGGQSGLLGTKDRTLQRREQRSSSSGHLYGWYKHISNLI